MHPRLGLSTAVEYGSRAAIGLGRNGHAPGVKLAVSLDDRRQQGHLYWRTAPRGADAQIAIEVSGVDKVDTGQRRLKEKVAQVARCMTTGQKVACVVELAPPRSRLKSA